MMRRSVWALMLAGVAMALPGCGVAGERLPDYRYRLTVEVETPEGLKTGSSVVEVQTPVTARRSRVSPPHIACVSVKVAKSIDWARYSGTSAAASVKLAILLSKRLREEGIRQHMQGGQQKIVVLDEFLRRNQNCSETQSYFAYLTYDRAESSEFIKSHLAINFRNRTIYSEENYIDLKRFSGALGPVHQLAVYSDIDRLESRIFQHIAWQER